MKNKQNTIAKPKPSKAKKVVRGTVILAQVLMTLVAIGGFGGVVVVVLRIFGKL